MKVSDLKNGRLYTDKDWVETYRFLGFWGYTYDFTRCEIDDNGRAVDTVEIVRFTGREVRGLTEI